MKEMAGADELISDGGEFRENPDVMAFDALRKNYGHREMNDVALAYIAPSLACRTTGSAEHTTFGTLLRMVSG